MKATINNIQFEGTPAEFAELIRLQTPTVVCAEDHQEFDEMYLKMLVEETRLMTDQWLHFGRIS